MEMEMQFVFAFICVCVGLFIFVTYPKKNGRKLPPGPMSLPIIGNALQIRNFPHLRFIELSRKYGPIFRIKIGMDDAVVLNDYKLIKELFGDSVSTGRTVGNKVMMEFTKGPYGIMNSEGHTWTQQRLFTVHTLRQFGFGRNSIENLVLDEVNSMLAWFHKIDEKPISGDKLFMRPIISILWRVITGEKCSSQDTSRTSILDATDKFFSAAMRISTNGLLFAPMLRYIMPNLMGWNNYVDTTNKMHKIIQEAFDKHKKHFDASNLQDYIDHHMFKIKSDHSSIPNPDENLIAGVFDLIFAGTETTSSTLSWGLLYLFSNPQVQTKLQSEIDNIIGTNSPSLIYRVQMPYTEAVISEILRMSSVAPLALPHQMLEDKIFKGFLLRKRTTIFANIHGVHYDPSVWTDPQLFQPERFMDETGTRFMKNEALISFSEGKRKCIGMQYARDEIFLFLVSILQQFTVLSADSTKSVDFEPICGLILSPKPFKVVMKRRKV